MKTTKNRETIAKMEKKMGNQKVELNITLNELWLIWEILFRKISEASGENIVIDDDMYWLVGAPECYDMTKEPALIVGSLKDDLEELKKLLNSKDRPTAFINLERFAAVLNAVSQKLNPI